MTDRLQGHLNQMPVIAILRGLMPEEAVDIGLALIESGIRVIEVPLNSPQPFESISRLSEAFSNRASIGAGTVTKIWHVQELASAGGVLSVSPNMNGEVIRAAIKHKIEPFPGVFSPSEAFEAVTAGARHLKLFPAGVLGPAMFKAMSDVLPGDIEFYAVGGVNAANMIDWFSSGMAGVGIGGGLYKPGDSADTVARKTKEIVQAYKAIQ